MKKFPGKKLFSLPELIAFRKDMHQHAEIGFKEVNTQKKIIAYLEKIGIDKKSIQKCAKTGLYVDLKGKAPSLSPDKLFAFRADIDALETFEGNKDLPYRSINKAAHLCGHDGHTTSLLGFAAKFMEKIDQIPQNKGIRLLFQPCEEGSRDSKGGAIVMIKEGALKGVEEIYGFHNWPTHTPGYLLVTPGPMMSEAIMINIKIQGKGGHGSNPKICNDPIQPAIDIHLFYRNLMKDMESKFGDKVRSSLPVFQAGNIFNVIPDQCRLEGTFRSLDNDAGVEFIEKFSKAVEEIVAKYGCTVEKRIESVFPILNNTQAEADFIEKLGREFFGDEKVNDSILPSYASEDFAYYTKEIPGCFFFLGSAKCDNDIFLHTENFNFNDNLISLASDFWLKIAERKLELPSNIFNIKPYNKEEEKKVEPESKISDENKKIQVENKKPKTIPKVPFKKAEQKKKIEHPSIKKVEEKVNVPKVAVPKKSEKKVEAKGKVPLGVTKTIKKSVGKKDKTPSGKKSTQK